MSESIALLVLTALTAVLWRLCLLEMLVAYVFP